MRLFTEAERVEVWDRRQAGEGNRWIGRRLGRSGGSIRAFVESSGGVRPPVRRRASLHLSLDEREEISRGVAAGESSAVIGSRLGRAGSTISRELARNGGRDRYRGLVEKVAAWPSGVYPQICTRHLISSGSPESRYHATWARRPASKDIEGFQPSALEMAVVSPPVL